MKARADRLGELRGEPETVGLESAAFDHRKKCGLHLRGVGGQGGSHMRAVWVVFI